MHRGRPSLDTEKATRLLSAGATVRETAVACGVSVQALHKAIRVGRVSTEGTAA